MAYTVPPPGPNSPPGYHPPPRPYNPPRPQSYQPPTAARPDVWDRGFRRISSVFQNSTVGAGFLAIALFLLIAFSSNILLAQVTSTTLGITVILSTLGLMALLVLMLVLI